MPFCSDFGSQILKGSRIWGCIFMLTPHCPLVLSPHEYTRTSSSSEDLVVKKV
jgi:hypothetical protein